MSTPVDSSDNKDPITKRTLSFGTLDDLKWLHGPFHVQVDNDVKSIAATLHQLFLDMKDHDSTYFTKQY